MSAGGGSSDPIPTGHAKDQREEVKAKLHIHGLCRGGKFTLNLSKVNRGYGAAC